MPHALASSSICIVYGHERLVPGSALAGCPLKSCVSYRGLLCLYRSAEFTGFEEQTGPLTLPRDSDRIWRGSYKGKDWRYLVRPCSFTDSNSQCSAHCRDLKCAAGARVSVIAQRHACAHCHKFGYAARSNGVEDGKAEPCRRTGCG